MKSHVRRLKKLEDLTRHLRARREAEQVDVEHRDVVLAMTDAELIAVVREDLAEGTYSGAAAPCGPVALTDGQAAILAKAIRLRALHGARQGLKGLTDEEVDALHFLLELVECDLTLDAEELAAIRARRGDDFMRLQSLNRAPDATDAQNSGENADAAPHHDEPAAIDQLAANTTGGRK